MAMATSRQRWNSGRQATGKGKDPQHHVDYQTKADDGAGPDAGAVGGGYLPDENDIRASYAPAGKHSRA
jgi:hypothetical protein